MTPIFIIVEGKNDRERLLLLIGVQVEVVCTYGIPTHARLLAMKEQLEGGEIIIFTDNDKVGRRIRAILSEEFPDALHLHTKIEYGGVERTPLAYLKELFAKHDIPTNSAT